MKFFKYGLASLFLIFACFATTNAFAQADKTGLDLRVGLAVPYYAGASSSVDFDMGELNASGLSAVGVGLDVQVLYRWTYFGLGIEQLIGGVFALDKTVSFSGNLDDANVNASFFDEGDGAFYGATFFLLKEYIPIGHSHLITISEGLGATYGAKLDHKRLYVTDSDAAFGVKLDLGYTYFIMETYGVGVNFEYHASLAFNDGISISSAFIPQIFFNMVF